MPRVSDARMHMRVRHMRLLPTRRNVHLRINKCMCMHVSTHAHALTRTRPRASLPAFTDEFMQSTPLTRIRDIAHRGDIPHELKQEIKHTIQARAWTRARGRAQTACAACGSHPQTPS